MCPKGHGVLMRCEYDHDTVCEECIDDTFSEQESSLDPCLPCAICEEDTEILIRECTPTADAYCHGERNTCTHACKPTHTHAHF